jgi:hypothetical protein
MLGPQIGEGRGKRTSRRVIATAPEARVEVSFEEKITVLGIEGMSIGTYVSAVRADGSVHGEGEGILHDPRRRVRHLEGARSRAAKPGWLGRVCRIAELQHHRPEARQA